MSQTILTGVYDPRADADYMAAIEALKQHSSTKPTYQNSYKDELEELYTQIVNRPSFSYDPNADALYSQYKDNYVNLGRRAMRDTMAQASALTGGYASSYAQAVSQQQMGEYMQELSAALPEFYDRALAGYNAQGESLMGLYELTDSRADEEYSRYSDALKSYSDQLDYLTAQAKDAYDRGFKRREDAHSKLVELMQYSGYVPTDEDLTNAGMTRAQADAYLKAWQVANPMLAYQNGIITAEQYFSMVGKYPPGYSTGGGGGYSGGSTKKKKTEKVDKFDIVSQRAQIEADYNAGRIDYDDREQLVNKLYGWN